MIVEIIDGRPVGYLTVEEYAAKQYTTVYVVRQFIYKKRLEVLKIGKGVWIHEETSYPKDRRHKENR